MCYSSRTSSTNRPVSDTDYEEVKPFHNYHLRYRRKYHNSTRWSSAPARKLYSICLGTLDPDNDEKDFFLYPNVQIKTYSKTITTKHTALWTTITQQTDHICPTTIEYPAQYCNSLWYTSPHHILTFKLFTLSRNLKNHDIVNSNLIHMLLFHLNVICRHLPFLPFPDQFVPHLFITIPFAIISKSFHHI